MTWVCVCGHDQPNHAHAIGGCGLCDCAYFRRPAPTDLTPDELAAHDRQVAERAWDEGYALAIANHKPFPGFCTWGRAGNPYRADAVTRQADTPAADDEGGRG